MGGGEGGAHEGLVAFWDVEDAATTGGEKPSEVKANVVRSQPCGH
jgi:hypothetical protein